MRLLPFFYVSIIGQRWMKAAPRFAPTTLHASTESRVKSWLARWRIEAVYTIHENGISTGGWQDFEQHGMIGSRCEVHKWIMVFVGIRRPFLPSETKPRIFRVH